MPQQAPQINIFLRAFLNRAHTRRPLGLCYYGIALSFSIIGPSSSSPLMHEGKSRSTEASSGIGATS